MTTPQSHHNRQNKFCIPQHWNWMLCTLRARVYWLEYIVIPWNSSSHEAVSCANTQILPAFYGTKWITTLFTRTLQWSLLWASSIQSTPPHSISQTSILILSTLLHRGHSDVLFPCSFHARNLYAFICALFMLYILPVPSWLDQFKYAYGRVETILHIVPYSCYTTVQNVIAYLRNSLHLQCTICPW
jgi:hypothetical protein